MLNYAAATDLGNQRDNNEDCYIECPELSLWVMADGVGGHDAGEVASAIACAVIREEIAAGQSLEEALGAAHRAIQAAPAQGQGKAGMASTAVALLVYGAEYQIAWVGDSRAYLFSDKVLTQLSRDHSFVQHLLDQGTITPAEAVNHPRRNLVLQALGQENLDAVAVDTVRGHFTNGDQIMLCSDGLTDYVSDADIEQIMAASSSAQDSVARLVAAAKATAGKDNITALVITLIAAPLPETEKIVAGNQQKNIHRRVLQIVLACAVAALVAVWWFNR